MRHLTQPDGDGMSSDARATTRAPRALLHRRDRAGGPSRPLHGAPELSPDRPGPTVSSRLAAARWLTPSRAGLLALAVVLEVGVLWAIHDAIVDDGYISLDYARTLAFHGEWGAIPGIPANSATSPLNVMALAAITVVVRSPMAALWVLAIANAATLGVGLLRLGQAWRVGDRLAWIAVPLLVLNPVIASSTGLETAMTVTAVVWLLDAGARAGDTTSGARGSWRQFGWLSGAAVVLRPDLVIVVAVCWLLHPALRRPSTLPAIVGTAWRAALLGLPWYVFSWLYFGSAIPDTLVVKRDQSWGRFDVGLWQRYGHLYPWAIAGVTIAAAVGLLVLFALPASRWTRFRPVALSVAACGLAGLAYYGAYTRLHVPPYFWYYGIPLAALTIVAAFGISAVTTELTRIPRLRLNGGRVVAAATGAALVAPMLVAWGTGLAQHAPLSQAPVHGNWALPFQYRQIGDDLARRLPPGAVVRSAGEFGTILYYCHCTLIDRLDQRGLIMPELVDAQHGSWPMRLNYAWLDPSAYPPMTQDFHLAHDRGRTTLPRAWNVWSPEGGWGHYRLRPGPKPLDLKQGLVP
jgi:hypothetical protein